MSLPRMPPHLRFRQRQQIAAVEADVAGDPAGRLGISRRIDIEVTDLPQPDSPTIPTVSPGST